MQLIYLFLFCSVKHNLRNSCSARETHAQHMAHGDDIIVIDSGDDDEPSNVIELSYVITKTQTFMFTITRKIKFLNGNIVDVNTHLQNDNYEQI